jgi:hypothetical protein
MSFDFDVTKPADTDNISDFPANEQAQRTTVDGWTDTDHYAADGKHRAIRLKEQATPTVSADEIGLYGKLIAGKCNLVIKDEDANEIQLTEGGNIKIDKLLEAALGLTISGAPLILTGQDIQLDNTRKITQDDFGGTQRDMMQIDASDVVKFGNTTLATTEVLVNALTGLLARHAGGTARILTVDDEGSGNGLDADTVDGQEAANFLSFDTGTPLYATGEIDPFVINSSLTFAHGLGALPRLWTVSLVCTNAWLGWAVDEEVMIHDHAETSRSITSWADGTNIGVETLAVPSLVRKDVSTTGVITAGDWKLRFRAWL